MRAPSARAAMAGLATLHIVAFAATLWLTMIREPFWDMLAWLDAYMRFRADGGLLNYAFGLHNEHRLAWIRLLTASDAEAYGSGGLAFIVASTVALVVAAGLVTWEAGRIMSPRGAAA